MTSDLALCPKCYEGFVIKEKLTGVYKCKICRHLVVVEEE